MIRHEISAHHMYLLAGSLFCRLAAVLLGLVFMVVGLAFTVSLVLLPAGVVIGLLGVGFLVGGLFAHIAPDA
jgi:hypothetical protein